jgi:peroxiredoxin-like protein
MHPFPHRYTASAHATAEGATMVASDGVPDLVTAIPPQFGGTGGQWSPETLFIGAVADCFALTFRAMAAASKLSWLSLDCEAAGEVDRVDGVVRFTAIALRARLLVSANTDIERARRLLEKAERGCLVTRSLAFEASLEADVASE